MKFFTFRIRNAEYRQLLDQTNDDDNNIDAFDQRNIQMHGHRQRMIRRENVLEAQIQIGDTLQAIALRYNCTVGVFVSLKFPSKYIMWNVRKCQINKH